MILASMPRRIKESRSFLAPLAQNLVRRINSTDQRLRRKLIRYGSWLLGLLFCYSLFVGSFSLPRIARLEMERRFLVQANQQLSVELADTARMKKLLLDDPTYIEYIARTRYHMARPNETIYRYRGR